MSKLPLLSEQRIKAHIKSAYDIEVDRLTLLHLGADIDATVYEAQSSQLSYFVKLKHGVPNETPFDVVQFLQNAKIEHVIPRLKTLNAQESVCVDNFNVQVYPFIKGQDGFNRPLTNTQWVTLGKVLRQVHELEVPEPLKAKIRKEDYSPKSRETVIALMGSIHDVPQGDEVASMFATFVKKHSVTIEQLVHKAASLATLLQSQSLQFVLCHSDIHGGNVLIDENDHFYIVDWDLPIMAPKERDLMFIGGGVGNVWNNPKEESLFYEGYGKTVINQELLAYYRLERIVEDVAEYAQQLLHTTGDRDERMQSYQHCIAQFEPQGVVEIALKTEAELSNSIS